jgi:hypothetical protein
MRLVAGSAMVVRGFLGLDGNLSIGTASALCAGIALGLLIIIGLWTPVTGGLIALLEAGCLVARVGDPWMHLFVATIAIGLSLLGPGAWSVDARLFGWRRIDIDLTDPPARS